MQFQTYTRTYKIHFIDIGSWHQDSNIICCISDGIAEENYHVLPLHNRYLGTEPAARCNYFYSCKLKIAVIMSWIA